MAKKKSSLRDRPLFVEITDGMLIISIGVDTLADATSRSPRFYDYGVHGGTDRETGPYFEITDSDEFAEGIASAMQDEQEDGSSPLGDFLDEMAAAAMDDGTLGVDYD